MWGNRVRINQNSLTSQENISDSLFGTKSHDLTKVHNIEIEFWRVSVRLIDHNETIIDGHNYVLGNHCLREIKRIFRP